MPYIIYDGIEYLIKNIDGCANYPETSSKIENWREHSLWIFNVIDLGI